MTTENNSILKSRQTNINWQLVIILMMGAFGVMGGAILAPGLPALSKAFSVSQDQVGLVLSVYTLAAALTLPFIGLMIDLLGRKKTGFACLLIDGTFGLLCIIAPTFITLLIFRFIQGIGIAGLIPVAMTIISDWFKGEKRLKVMGFLSGTISLSAVLIPLLGGIIATISWKLPFAVYGFSLFLAIFFFFNIKETNRNSKEEKEINSKNINKYFKNLYNTLKIKQVQEVFIHSLLVYFLLYTLVTFLPLFLAQNHSLSEFWAGIALSLQGFFAAIIASKADLVDHYLDWKKKLYLGFTIITIALFSFPLWSNHYTISISIFLFGIGMGIIQPAIYDKATTVAPEKQLGSVIALFNTMKFIGMSLAPILLRLVYIKYTLQTVFTAAAFLPLIWIIILLLKKH